MSKWSEGADLLQKLITAKEVAPIQNDLINLQQTMFSLQADQMKLIDDNSKLKIQVEKLQKKRDYTYEEGHTWFIHPERPDIKLCPVCLGRDDFENPMTPNGGRQWCRTCSKEFK